MQSSFFPFKTTNHAHTCIHLGGKFNLLGGGGKLRG